MERSQILLVTRTASIVVVLAAIVAQAVELANHDAFDPTRFFAYFTIQSNLIGVAAFAWLLANRGRPAQPRPRVVPRRGGRLPDGHVPRRDRPAVERRRRAPLGLGRLRPPQAVPGHRRARLVPRPADRAPDGRDVVAWMVYPLVWRGLTLVRGAADGWYPYPFLDPANGGYGSVAVVDRRDHDRVPGPRCRLRLARQPARRAPRAEAQPA